MKRDRPKMETHVWRFAEAAVGRTLNDQDVIELTTKAAQCIGIKVLRARLADLGSVARRQPPYPGQPTDDTDR